MHNGVNAKIAEKLGLINCKVLAPSQEINTISEGVAQNQKQTSDEDTSDTEQESNLELDSHNSSTS